ncbi:MAG: FG-GAP-like repeat-containing protein, partial [Gemmataceae bacterium]|nr:FG-GAP-like repeat-containing protein [Gemmataceae bacterium]
IIIQNAGVTTKAYGSLIFDRKSISAIVFNPTKNKDEVRTVYLAANSYSATKAVQDHDNVYRSDDGGKSWTEVGAVPAPMGANGNIVTDLTAISYGGQDYLIAGTGEVKGGVGAGGIWYSANKGSEWKPASVRLTSGVGGIVSAVALDIQRVSFATDKARGFVYAAVYRDDKTELLQSYDGGQNWSTVTIAQPPQFASPLGTYALAIGVSETTGRVYVGGYVKTDPTSPHYGVFESDAPVEIAPGQYDVSNPIRAWRMIDLGANTSGGKTAVPHTDFHAWAFDADGSPYAGTDGGIYRFTPKPLDPDVLDVHPGAGKSPERWFVQVADLNGDGFGDLIYTSRGDTDRGLGTMLGNGDGTYADKYSVELQYLTATATGDFNGDGITDLVGVATTERQMWLLLGEEGVDPVTGKGTGKGTGNFQAARKIAALGKEPKDIAVGDFDGDGVPDIAIAETGDNRVAIYLGQKGADKKANGNFKQVAAVAVADPQQVSVGYFDGPDK